MDDFSPLTCVFKSQLPHRHIHIEGGCIKSHNIETQCTVRADHVLPCAQPCFFSSACNFVMGGGSVACFSSKNFLWSQGCALCSTCVTEMLVPFAHWDGRRQLSCFWAVLALTQSSNPEWLSASKLSLKPLRIPVCTYSNHIGAYFCTCCWLCKPFAQNFFCFYQDLDCASRAREEALLLLR